MKISGIKTGLRTLCTSSLVHNVLLQHEVHCLGFLKKRIQTGQVRVGTHLRFRGDSGKWPSRLPAAPEPAEHKPHFTSACSIPASNWLTQQVAATSSLSFQRS